MKIFKVSATDVVYGFYECENSREARDACAVEGGYESEWDMIERLGSLSEFEVEEVVQS
jgi:hypothetical protein